MTLINTQNRDVTVKKLAVLVTTSPYSNLSVTALDYIETALQSGIELVGVFFYQNGVMHANKGIQIASDEFQAIQHWQRLQQTYNLPLHLCITAAEKRGMSDENTESIHSIFTVSGLGELVELSTKADRMVQL
ncbi:sulfurtransferase complex subunit TusD [Colwellia sp. 20A7]|uniref:sulfurtransferase complex subunit TusD n=1 Tax=Colwellia sp. 20A7 TaxID=2689569 RepID=UPI001F2F90B9|nr:sulfurtransferase complex subunit TusD [Colwellia sp. 20A7]